MSYTHVSILKTCLTPVAFLHRRLLPAWIQNCLWDIYIEYAWEKPEYLGRAAGISYKLQRQTVWLLCEVIAPFLWLIPWFAQLTWYLALQGCMVAQWRDTFSPICLQQPFVKPENPIPWYTDLWSAEPSSPHIAKIDIPDHYLAIRMAPLTLLEISTALKDQVAKIRDESRGLNWGLILEKTGQLIHT